MTLSLLVLSKDQTVTLSLQALSQYQTWSLAYWYSHENWLSVSKASILARGRLFKKLQKVISHKSTNGVISYTMIYVQAVILGQLQKVISYKYANGIISYTMIYVQAAILEQLRKNKEEEERPYWGHYGKMRKKRNHIGDTMEK